MLSVHIFSPFSQDSIRHRFPSGSKCGYFKTLLAHKTKAVKSLQSTQTMISRHHLPLSRCLILYITMLAGLVSSLQDATSSSLRGFHENERLLQKTVNRENESFSELQLEYFETCTETFLSDKVVGDGIISQNDFTEHLVQFCETYSAPEMTEFPFQCPDNSFTSLPVDVQLIFTYGVCKTDKGYPHQMKCLESLDSLSEMGADFGYIVTPETRTDVEVSVENLCFNLFPIVFRKSSQPFPLYYDLMVSCSPSLILQLQVRAKMEHIRHRRMAFLEMEGRMKTRKQMDPS